MKKQAPTDIEKVRRILRDMSHVFGRRHGTRMRAGVDVAIAHVDKLLAESPAGDAGESDARKPTDSTCGDEDIDWQINVLCEAAYAFADAPHELDVDKCPIAKSERDEERQLKAMIRARLQAAEKELAEARKNSDALEGVLVTLEQETAKLGRPFGHDLLTWIRDLAAAKADRDAFREELDTQNARGGE